MIFITGTDTGIGKTYVSSIIGSHLKYKENVDVGYLKPIETGGMEDTLTLKNTLNLEEDLSILNPINLKSPLSPNIAFEIEGYDITLDEIKERIKMSFDVLSKKYRYLIVEGAGGVAVPIKDNFVMSDLIKFLDLPALIVSKPNLGTINHTLLTVEHLRNKGIEVKGIVINCITKLEDVLYYEKTFETIEKYGDVEILGIVKSKEDYNIQFKKLLE
ncbi:MAG TPA: dethiobiotin synthase [Methanothermococcus okinawensis]|uniref:ATP-dependent dethiobiotin synthetase BioD n=1 Tax=Methanofervidicoccus abyssi TaxID=2082189 RepID=A0A401HQE6_9EURY|nr:dethiobiotin synthase [Methanofervidicoccus abyssi]GBF36507.1 dethiobiotin synthetase [Methanofervidicoccus abyssi]HIP34589.1 dethiobiotin synthase [Methanothermococcus okinawensis]